MARIALNGRLLVPGKLEGIGRFTLRNLAELVAHRPHDQFLLIVDRPDHEMFHLGPNVEIHRIRIPARRPWLIRWWFGRPLSRVLRRWRAEVFVSLEGPLATQMPADFPQLTVIHDLNFEHRPEGLPPRWARFYRSEFPKYARRAQVLGTVSEWSRQDLAQTYGLTPSDIRIFPNAADASFVPCTTEKRAQAQSEFAAGNPYFVYVGSLHPRKNVDGLLRAFEGYCQKQGAWDLVVVGVPMWSDDLPVLAQHAKRRVHFAGRLQDDALVSVVAGAQALVFVPWFEGFGIPVVEAMACGVPVIASNVTSLPEVCGCAAYDLVSPGDAEAIASAMCRLERDPEGAQRASQRGRSRSAQYSWTETATHLSRALDDLLLTP